MKYFLYSIEQIKEKNSILARTGKCFEPGTVVVNGTKMRFSQLSDTPSIPRFVDSKVIAKGELKDFVYTMPKTSTKRDN